jgi:hypothetical protein
MSSAVRRPVRHFGPYRRNMLVLERVFAPMSESRQWQSRRPTTRRATLSATISPGLRLTIVQNGSTTALEMLTMRKPLSRREREKLETAAENQLRVCILLGKSYLCVREVGTGDVERIGETLRRECVAFVKALRPLADGDDLTSWFHDAKRTSSEHGRKFLLRTITRIGTTADRNAALYKFWRSFQSETVVLPLLPRHGVSLVIDSTAIELLYDWPYGQPRPPVRPELSDGLGAAAGFSPQIAAPLLATMPPPFSGVAVRLSIGGHRLARLLLR